MKIEALADAITDIIRLKINSRSIRKKNFKFLILGITSMEHNYDQPIYCNISITPNVYVFK